VARKKNHFNRLNNTLLSLEKNSISLISLNKKWDVKQLYTRVSYIICSLQHNMLSSARRLRFCLSDCLEKDDFFPFCQTPWFHFQLIVDETQRVCNAMRGDKQIMQITCFFVCANILRSHLLFFAPFRHSASHVRFCRRVA
jgi:hypothetical protein